MVNMNKMKQPAVYALKHDGGFFYVGYTSSNAKNRWWQHISRAQNGHRAPVYQWMRDVGIRNVTYEVLQFVNDGEDHASIEAGWIMRFITEGHPLKNQVALDGVPNSISPSMKANIGLGQSGRSSWSAGLVGEQAGWTQSRKDSFTAIAKRKSAQKEMDSPKLLFARVQGLEIKAIKALVSSLERPIPPLAKRRPLIGEAHGTRAMYERSGCRCQQCRDEMARHNARKRGKQNWESVTAKPIEPRYKRHGTAASYTHRGCRCDECKMAIRAARQTGGAKGAVC